MKNKILITNKFNLNDTVKHKNFKHKYRIIGMDLDNINEKCNKIWYKCLQNDGHICTICESVLEKIQ